jgi:GNAT superfamily N-acetyltransferase
MGADAEYECQTLTGYDPSIFEGAVFAVDGDVVGYLAWNETFDEESSIALRQVFVRDEYRGQQIADEMIASWWESRPETFLYVGDPNPAGRRVIERLGLYDETVDGQVVAKDTYVMPSVGVPVREPLV